MAEKLRAIVRAPGDLFVEALSRHPERDSIDPALARKQHLEFRRVLKSLGVSLIELEASEEFPDACFTADVAVVVQGRPLILRTGALSRRGEASDIDPILASAEYMESPATLEGGDVLNFGDRLVVGLSGRTNAAGIEKLRNFARIPVSSIEVPEGVLHLGTVSSVVADDAVIGVKEVVADKAFGDAERLIVPEDEALGGNIVVIGRYAIAAAGYPVTRQLLEDRGLTVHEIDLSEFTKADGGPSCLTLFF